jgi:hypothetical protein
MLDHQTQGEHVKKIAFLSAGILGLCCFAFGGIASAQSAHSQRVPPDAINKYVGSNGSIKEIAPIFSQLLLVSVPGNFRPVSEHVGNAGTFYIQESVPAGESETQWTQMITKTGAKDLASKINITPQFLAANLAKRFDSVCPTSFSSLNLGEVQLSGVYAYAMVASCGAVTEGSASHSESTLIVEIKGSNDYYGLQWAIRGPASAQPMALDEATWRGRLQKLQPIKLCPIVPGEQMPYPSCAG